MCLPTAYLNWLPVHCENFVRVPDEDLLQVDRVSRGIVFVLARWSGASQLSFRTLTSVLNQIPGAASIQVLILDSDSLAAERFRESVGEVPSGRGETYWIRGGRVVAKVHTCDDATRDSIRSHTEAMLAGL
jgi:hypothetical protein